MAGRFYGEVGYAIQVEKSPGVWVEEIVERKYYGNVEKTMSRMRDGENLNKNLVIDNQLSIIANPYAYANFSAIRYIVWMGTKWQIASVDVRRPRLFLTMGGVYHEQGTTATTP